MAYQPPYRSNGSGCRTAIRSGSAQSLLFDTFYPPGGAGRRARGSPLAETLQVEARTGLVDPFYTWASVIVDGRVVATDYAPDVGWLDPTLR